MGGLGLGLAISKRLVEMHGGTMTVHSTGEEGAGSTFSFSLPTVPPPLEQVRRQKKIAVLTTKRSGVDQRSEYH
ncbi:hypothetical protein HC928_18590 [bacterium]|nr:hypothetical protein [bacterium]